MSTVADQVPDVIQKADVGGRARFAPLIAEVANWRMLQNTRTKVEKPILGLLRGVGAIEKGDKLTPARLLELVIEHGAPQWMADTMILLTAAEKDAAKRIQVPWRDHPLLPFGESIQGLGDHSLAVVVGLLDGDPYIAYPRRRVGPRGKSVMVDDDPYIRSFSQLVSYCGLNPERRRFEGMSQDDLLALGKPYLKSRLQFVMAPSIALKTPEPRFHAVYEEARERYAERTHRRPCAPCHAKAGEPWRKGHQYTAALRLVAKAFLGELYDEAKRLHEEDSW